MTSRIAPTTRLARHEIWNLQTAHGKLDLTFHPSGFPDGYKQLRPRAARREVAQTSANVQVAGRAVDAV